MSANICFQSLQMFISEAIVQAPGIEYHVGLAQNILQQCLDMTELQNELLCGLVKQTSRHTHHKGGVQVNRTASKLKHSRVSVLLFLIFLIFYFNPKE